MFNFLISETNKNIIKVMLAISFISLGVGSFFASNFYTYFLGTILGTGFSILKLILLEATLQKSLNMLPEKSTNYVRLHYSLRYLLTGIVLLIAAKNNNISLIATIIGLLSLRPAIYVLNIKNRNVNK